MALNLQTQKTSLTLIVNKACYAAVEALTPIVINNGRWRRNH